MEYMDHVDPNQGSDGGVSDTSKDDPDEIEHVNPGKKWSILTSSGQSRGRRLLIVGFSLCSEYMHAEAVAQTISRL